MTRRFIPVVKTKPEGFLVYDGMRLVTEMAVSRDDAQTVFDSLVEEPSSRPRIIAVHNLTTQSRRVFAR